MEPFWVRRNFSLPDLNTNQRLWLRIGGIQPAAEIYLNGTDETLSKATTAKIGETVNVTFIYKDTFEAFIDSATVTITIGADTKNLIEMSSYYYIIVNTSALSLGENFHTISASRITYESQEEQIKIEKMQK